MFAVQGKEIDLDCHSIGIEKEITPYTLFHEIRNHLLMDQDLLRTLLYNVDKKLLRGINSYLKDDLLYSCTVNFYLLSMLFVGEKRTKQVHNALSLTISEKINIVPDERKEPISVLFHHFLSGNEVLRQNKEYAAKGESYKFSSEEIQQSFDLETEYVKYRNLFKQKVSDLYCGKHVTDLDKFCEPVINSLKSELFQNAKTVSRNCSYIYHVSITTPPLEFMLKATKDEILKAPIGHYHSFILEQYYSDEKKEVFIRLHQSWKNKFTLLEHYNNMGYRDGDQGCYNCYEVDALLEGLNGLLISQKHSEINCEPYKYACSNLLNESILPVSVFRENDQIFSGKSIRFMTSKINLTEAFGHYHAIIQKYS